MIPRQIPNALTLTRLLLIAPFLVFLYQQKYVTAFYVFLFAGFTDALDGWLARLCHWQSSFGTFVDPMADKLLIAASFISLAFIGKLPWWLVVLVFLRDLTISFGVIAWYRFIQQKPELKPTLLSKANTVLQLTIVTVCLFELAFFEFNPMFFNILLILTTITTATSFIDYLWIWGRKAYLSTPSSK